MEKSSIPVRIAMKKRLLNLISWSAISSELHSLQGCLIANADVAISSQTHVILALRVQLNLPKQIAHTTKLNAPALVHQDELKCLPLLSLLSPHVEGSRVVHYIGTTFFFKKKTSNKLTIPKFSSNTSLICTLIGVSIHIGNTIIHLLVMDDWSLVQSQH